MAHLVEQSLPTLEVGGSNPVIGKLSHRAFVYSQLWRKDIKKKWPAMAHF